MHWLLKLFAERAAPPEPAPVPPKERPEWVRQALASLKSDGWVVVAEPVTVEVVPVQRPRIDPADVYGLYEGA